MSKNRIAQLYPPTHFNVFPFLFIFFFFFLDSLFDFYIVRLTNYALLLCHMFMIIY